MLVVGVLKPLAAQQIEPRLHCLLFLPAIFREVVGEEEEKEEEGSRLHIFQPLLSAPTSRAEHNEKERGSVIRLRAHKTQFIGISPSHTVMIMHVPFIVTLI